MTKKKKPSGFFRNGAYSQDSPGRCGGTAGNGRPAVPLSGSVRCEQFGVGREDAAQTILSYVEQRPHPIAVEMRRRSRFPSPLPAKSEEHTSELQSRPHLVCRLLLEKKKFK